MKAVHETLTMLTNTCSDVVVEAEVDNFKEGKSFDAFVATNKIRMNWNGKVYVGNAHGMEFTSPGPAIRYIKEGRR